MYYTYQTHIVKQVKNWEKQRLVNTTMYMRDVISLTDLDFVARVARPYLYQEYHSYTYRFSCFQIIYIKLLTFSVK